MHNPWNRDSCLRRSGNSFSVRIIASRALSAQEVRQLYLMGK